MTKVPAQSTEPERGSDPASTTRGDSPVASALHARTLEARSRHAVNLTLALVVTALVLVMMAIPGSRRTRAQIESERLTTELQLTLDELRATIADYAASNGHFPGAGPSRHTDPFWIEHQLDLALRRSSESATRSGNTTLWSTTFGSPTSGSQASSTDTSAGDPRSAGRVRRRAFHIDDPVLENPLNGRSSVRFLAAAEPWPLDGDDSSGWLYRPATGEIRANSPGKSSWTGTRFLDM
jgi:hypothetical protein